MQFQQPLRRTHAHWYRNYTIVGAVPVLLEWGIDNRIRLSSQQSEKPMIHFDVEIKDIKNVTYTAGQLSFNFLPVASSSRKSYHLRIDPASSTPPDSQHNSIDLDLQTADIVEMLSMGRRRSQNELQNRDIQWWVFNLNKLGLLRVDTHAALARTLNMVTIILSGLVILVLFVAGVVLVTR